jgi:hypothetical protein
VYDVKQGYGEMYWADGSTYRGFWQDGVQSTLGIMTFNDGLKIAGFFNENVYTQPLKSIAEFEEFEVNCGNN